MIVLVVVVGDGGDNPKNQRWQAIFCTVSVVDNLSTYPHLSTGDDRATCASPRTASFYRHPIPMRCSFEPRFFPQSCPQLRRFIHRPSQVIHIWPIGCDGLARAGIAEERQPWTI